MGHRNSEGGGSFFEKQRFSHTLTRYRTLRQYPTHQILILEGDLGHINIFRTYDTHSGGPSAILRTDSEGGGLFSDFSYISSFFNVFQQFLKVKKHNLEFFTVYRNIIQCQKRVKKDILTLSYTLCIQLIIICLEISVVCSFQLISQLNIQNFNFLQINQFLSYRNTQYMKKHLFLMENKMQ